MSLLTAPSLHYSRILKTCPRCFSLNYNDLKSQASILQVSDAMTRKLRLLTVLFSTITISLKLHWSDFNYRVYEIWRKKSQVITLAETSRLIPYDHLQRELHVQNVSHFCLIFLFPFIYPHCIFKLHYVSVGAIIHRSGSLKTSWLTASLEALSVASLTRRRGCLRWSCITALEKYHLTFIYNFCNFSGQVDFVSGRDIRRMDIGNIVNVLQSWYYFELINYIAFRIPPIFEKMLFINQGWQLWCCAGHNWEAGC